MTDSNLHDKFFKKIYHHPRHAQDLLRLALPPEACGLFDLDNLTPSRDASIDPDTDKEKFCDLNFSLLDDERLQRDDIVTSPCLLGMKHIRNLTPTVVAKMLAWCRALAPEYKRSLTSYLISYLGKADNRYDRRDCLLSRWSIFLNYQRRDGLWRRSILASTKLGRKDISKA